MKMKKQIMEGPGKSVLVEVDRPEIQKDTEILVKLLMVGVCMSEHYAWSTAKAGTEFGHEPLGEVVAVGSAVTKVKVGDRVGSGCRGCAEYFVADEQDVVKVSDCLQNHEAILEPLQCLVSAVSKVRQPVIGEKVAVVGCGYMGCGAISLLKMRGVQVVAVDIRPECLTDAKRYGADEVYTPDTLPAEYTTVGGREFETGFPVVMEWGETNESLDLAIRMTRMCGQLAIGAYHTGGKRLVNIQMLNFKAIDCLSVHPRETELNRKAIALAEQLLVNGWCFRHVPTKVYPVTKFDEAQRDLTAKYGTYMKAVVDWTTFDGDPYIIG